MLLKTPGVYVQDLTPPQPIDPLIETGLPAFIGHTEKAVDDRGDSLRFVPVRVRDLTDFTALFGGPYIPETYDVYVDLGDEKRIDRVELPTQFYLYDCLRQFYENGGGDAFIISIGGYGDPVVLGDPANLESGFLKGLEVLEDHDEPSLLLFPDAMRLPRKDDGRSADLGQLQETAMRQGMERLDRFLIADVFDTGDAMESACLYRESFGTGEHLKFAAAYYPWLISSFEHTFHLSEFTFWDVSGDGAPVRIDPDDWDRFSNEDEASAIAVRHRELVDRARKRGADVLRLLDRFQDFGYTGRSVGNLSRDILAELGRLERAETDDKPAVFQRTIPLVRAMALLWPEVEAAIDSYTFDFQLILERFRDQENLTASLAELVFIERLEDVRNLSQPPLTVDEVDEIYASLIDSAWFRPAPGASPVTSANYLARIMEAVQDISEAVVRLFEDAGGLEAGAEEALFAGHPFFARVANAVRQERKKLPPSGAMAGVYAATDRLRGVWSAPANIALQATLGPTVVFDVHDQEPFNVHPTGKSINVIRPFRGRGIRIWGARTLMGNSLEWRYVSVRRYFNFVEEFIKKATEPYVFEANDANTWMHVKLALDQFLTAQWRRGALAGSTTPEAYFVQVGLGETMTAQDVLEGRIIIKVGLAVVRPAEFIVIRYILHIEGV